MHALLNYTELMRSKRFVIFFLLISFTINAFAWQSGANAIRHDIDHSERLLISAPNEHFDAHSLGDENGPDDFDHAVHQLLHGAGYAQPFAITEIQPVAVTSGVNCIDITLLVKVAQFESDTQFRPPRITS